MTGKITSLDCTSDGAQRIFRESHYGRRRRVVFVAAATAIGTLLPTAAFSPPVISRMAHINSQSFHPFSSSYHRSQTEMNADLGIDVMEREISSSSSSSSSSPLLPVPLECEEDEPRVGVLLLNLGGPEKTEDVEGFLYNLFADPDIIRLPPFLTPLQSLIALFISKRRAPKSRAAYNSIGGGSPILKYSNAQANLLAESLSHRYGIDAKTYVGMRYWYPFTEEALADIRKDKVNALVIVPLYPQFSISTSGSSLRLLQEEFAKNPDVWGGRNDKGTKMTHTVIPAWYNRPGYVRAVADLVKTELDAFTDEQISEGRAGHVDGVPLHVLFSAHGVPQSYIEAGDPYQRQIKECVSLISDLLPGEGEKGNGDVGFPDVRIHLSYQSRVGPIEWLRPYTDDVLPDLGKEGVKNIVVVPISFVSEHIETLEEIDIEYRELAEENGISNWRRCPALNTNPAFIGDMADMVYEALNEPIQSVTEACVANNVDLGDAVADVKGDISNAGVGGVGGEGLLSSKRAAASIVATTGLLAESTTALKEAFEGGERFNGRLAMMGLLGTAALEYGCGQPVTHFLFGIST